MRGCGCKTVQGGTCDSVLIPATMNYSIVCGRICAYQREESLAFGYSVDWSPIVLGVNATIDSPYLSGLSLTHGLVRQRKLTLLLLFTLCVDFLSIARKVIIFSAIATDDRHPLRSRSIHQNAANCMTIRFRYIAQLRGVRKTYCARSRNDVRRLTSRSNGMSSKKIRIN